MATNSSDQFASRDDIARVLELASHLGGPKCAVEDLQWASDIPAGRALLKWLASQVPDMPYAEDALSPNQGRDARVLQTRLTPIALYQEELDLLDAGRLRDHNESTRQEQATYELPFQLRVRTEALESEATLLEQQAARLKHRLTTSKAVAKDLKLALQALRKEIQAIDGTIQEQQQQLAELSAESDSGLAQHTIVALHALQDASPAESEGEDLLEQTKTRIARLSVGRSSVAGAAKRLYQTLDDGYASLPNATELQQNAHVLHKRFETIARDKDTLQRIGRAAYVQELERMTARIESSSDGAYEIAQILKAARQEGQLDAHATDVDVKAELEQGGKLDRTTLLKAQEKGLDEIIDYMRDELIPSLQETYAVLNARSEIATETEAIVSALIEELEDVNDTMENTRKPMAFATSTEQKDAEHLLEAEMSSLLKGLLGSHRDVDKPVVLLDRTDVERELATLTEGLSASQEAEEAWASALRGRLSQLSSSTVPLLSTAYANSPVNTSPPFAPDAGQVALMDSTRTKADSLRQAAVRLQKEAELSARDKRKLSAFVEKWVPGG